MSDEYVYCTFDLSTPEKIAGRAKALEGMTFRDVLDLGIAGEGVTEANYGDRSYKGGMGTLLEERFFCYKANSNQAPDFKEAGVELKATCYDVRKSGDLSAGERLVLTMIGYDEPIPDDFYESHAWEKMAKVMLVYYERDREIPKYDQRISYTFMFTPSEEDLEIIRTDYDKIASVVRDGRAEDLSENMTTYLGACTKGATAEKSMKAQYYPPHTRAKGRAFCLKRQYMDYVLHRYVMGQDGASEKIIGNPAELKEKTFEEIVLDRIDEYAGKTDRELCEMLGMEYTGNKAQWVRIVYRLLGVHGDRAEEFEKAGISVRTLRVKEDGKPKEAMSLAPFRFLDLLEEEWESAWLHEYFEETRFLFIVFQLDGDAVRLRDARFWSMLQSDIEGGLRECWERTRATIYAGVRLIPRQRRDGKIEYENDLPKDSDNIIAHVRPHAQRAAYRIPGQDDIGDVARDAEKLPDGRWMTRQSFWLDKSYIHRIVRLEDEGGA